MQTLTQTKIISKLNTQSVLLTPNQRLAQAWQTRYQAQQFKQGKTTWKTPTILPWLTWLQTIWQQQQHIDNKPLPALLKDWQWQWLWQKTLTQHLDKSQSHIQALAQLAQQAWDLLQQWQQPLPFDTRWQLTAEEISFTHWAKDIHTQLTTHNWLAPSQLATQLMHAWQTKQVIVPHTLILSGFDSFTPQQTEFFSVLTACGCQLYVEEPAQQQATIQVSAYPDLATELTAAAQWLHQQREHGAQHVACVVPNLTAIRTNVLTIFQRYFSDVNISAGLALSDYPLIQTALHLLKLHHSTHELTAFSQLLRSPYWGAAEHDFLNRHQLDAALRELGQHTLHQTDIWPLAEQHTPELFAAWQNWQRECARLPHEQSACTWADYFVQSLTALGWPGERNLNSTEYQLHERFKTLLQTLPQLDYLQEKFTYADALQQLIQLTRTTVFQPQRLQDHIHVLGVLEAAGLHFDAIWITGLHADQWPPAPQPNPFIPKALQRQQRMPHADPERELDYCQHIMQRLLHAAPHIYLSYFQQDEHHTLHPSPLLTDIHAQQVTPLDVTVSRYYSPLIPTELDTIDDFQAPALQHDEKVRGGSAILKYQAACPFQAFAKIRLGAEGLTIAQDGLSALDRGFLVHLALEHIWQTIKSHAALCALSETAYTQTIHTAVNRALEHCSLSSAFKQLEYQRLATLVRDWLALEKQRPPFTVVACEQQQSYTLAGLTFHLRIDRIDHTDTGDYLLIDYKTGQPSIYDWLDGRVSEPQLPLYSLAQPYPIAALMFAQVHPHTCCFKGISAHELDIKGVEPQENWSMQKITWQTRLTELAIEFQHGVARVDPQHGTRTCQYCDLHGLCRIGEVSHA